MLIDDINIKVVSGDGGNGAVAFNKNLMSLGPAGATGGHGGSVYAEGVPDLAALGQFRFKKIFAAERGEDGREQFRDGSDGKDLVLKLPVGTVVHNITDGREFEITKIGERFMLAEGGRGGKGNFHFRSSTNTSPKQYQEGKPGESFEFRFELKLIADVGFIGLPNAGKSSMLNELTNAKSKIGNYPFTTLEPNLGAYYELIIADIPGLIEGSSKGRGLGIKFLRHIERTGVLFHFISTESENLKKDYETIRKELKDYSKDLAEKKEYLILSKSDLIPEAEAKDKLAILKEFNPDVIAVSIHDIKSLKKLETILNKIKSAK
jgi:GTP-binding protein